MNKKIRLILLSCLLICLALLTVSCSGDNSPYGDYNKRGFSVSVKYDANGGIFATNTEVITDTYNLDSHKTNANGNKEILPIAPDDALRGQTQAYTVLNAQHIFVGWYKTKTENIDGNGNVTYSYSDKWNFGDKFEVDPDGEYSAETPVLTLYAVWIPEDDFRYEFYQVKDDGSTTLTGVKNVNPLKDTSLKLPATDTKTGKVNAANDFPEHAGYTYDKVSLSPDLSDVLTAETVSHQGSLDLNNAALENPVQKIYYSLREGEEYEIDTVKKFADAPKDAKLILMADLDFEGKVWPTLLRTSEFKGQLIGNGHTVKNIELTSENKNAARYGLFGNISEGAVIEDVIFENITVNIKVTKVGSFYGILAGEIADGGTVSGVTVKNSKMYITNASSAITDNVMFGLAAANGDCSGIAFDGDVTAEAKNFTSSSSTKNYTFNYANDASGKFTLTAV